MIMRRLAAHLREQNWTAIAIEFVLLVLGVFLGIQVANWNETRIERDLVPGHLSEIAQDLRTHEAIGEDLIDSAKMRIAAVDYIYREAFGTHLPTTLKLASRSWKAPKVDAFPPDQDQRPASEIVALARENPGFTAYLRSQREWAILNWNLLHNSGLETKALLAAIEQELAAP